MPEAGQYRCLIKIKDSKAMLSFVQTMSHLQSTAYQEPPKIFGADSFQKRVPIPADPLADARAWLAAMEISLQQTAQQAAAQPADPLADARAWLAAMEISHRRTARQAAQHSGNVIKLRSASPNDDPPGNQFLEGSRQM
jgi:hypothetical protein